MEVLVFKTLLATTVVLSLVSAPLMAEPNKKKGQDCVKEEQKVRNREKYCLKIENPDEKKVCMDQLLEMSHRAPQECSPMLKPIQMKIMDKASKMDRQQSPSVGGNKNNKTGQHPQQNSGQGRDEMKSGDRE
jgi:hypothetical protein